MQEKTKHYAQESLERSYYFDATLMEPPISKLFDHININKLLSWINHAVKGWHIGS